MSYSCNTYIYIYILREKRGYDSIKERSCSRNGTWLLDGRSVISARPSGIMLRIYIQVEKI